MGRTGLYVLRKSRSGISRGRKKGNPKKKPEVIREPVSPPNTDVSPETKGHEGHKIGIFDRNKRCFTCRTVISYIKR